MDTTERINQEIARLVAEGWDRRNAARAAWMGLFAEAEDRRRVADRELAARLAPENVRDWGVDGALKRAVKMPRRRRDA